MHSDEIRADQYQCMREKTVKGEDMYRVIAEPILHLPLISIIPCNLHCIMAVMRKLVQLLFFTHMDVLHVSTNNNQMKFMLLAQDVEQSAPLAAEFERLLLTKCNVKLPPVKKPKGRHGVAKTFSEQVKQARSSPHTSSVWSHSDTNVPWV
jgi:hypothetical protein